MDLLSQPQKTFNYILLPHYVLTSCLMLLHNVLLNEQVYGKGVTLHALPQPEIPYIAMQGKSISPLATTVSK
jgi:hypothetical protein